MDIESAIKLFGGEEKYIELMIKYLKGKLLIHQNRIKLFKEIA